MGDLLLRASGPATHAHAHASACRLCIHNMCAWVLQCSEKHISIRQKLCFEGPSLPVGKFHLKTIFEVIDCSFLPPVSTFRMGTTFDSVCIGVDFQPCTRGVTRLTHEREFGGRPGERAVLVLDL